MLDATKQDSLLRGIVLKTLYDINSMSTLYLRIDVVEGLCSVKHNDFERVVEQLVNTKLIGEEFQHSFILQDNINAIRITGGQTGI